MLCSSMLQHVRLAALGSPRLQIGIDTSVADRLASMVIPDLQCQFLLVVGAGYPIGISLKRGPQIIDAFLRAAAAT